MTDKITDAQIDDMVKRFRYAGIRPLYDYVTLVADAESMLAALKAERTRPIKTLRQAHEEAAGMGLEASFFTRNGIDPDAPADAPHQSDAIASAERLTAQPVKTLREARETGATHAWVWIDQGDHKDHDYRWTLIDLVRGGFLGETGEASPAIPIIQPQPLPSTPEQEDQSP